MRDERQLTTRAAAYQRHSQVTKSSMSSFHGFLMVIVAAVRPLLRHSLKANYFRSLNNANASSSLRSIPCNAASCAALNAFSASDGFAAAAGTCTC